MQRLYSFSFISLPGFIASISWRVSRRAMFIAAPLYMTMQHEYSHSISSISEAREPYTSG